MAKKSYNPFKMWGSYIGVIIGLILSLVTLLQDGFCIIDPFTPNDCGIQWNSFFISLPIYVPLGFLIGYGIHSLVRYLRR